jgi:outer membrane protein OmpA-like peptidoglycan-associated protein
LTRKKHFNGGGQIVNRTTILWLGVVLFMALCVLCLLCHAKRIETKLFENATAALQTAGIGGIDVSFDGRNAIISGTVASDELKQKAAALIASLPGVRSVANNITVEKPEIELPEPALETAEIVAKPEVVKPEVNLPELLSKLIPNFATDRSELNAPAQTALKQLAALLKDKPEVKLKIVGHADSQGTDEYNQKLGLRRAQAVKTFLVNHGLPAERFTVVSLGESKPIVDNSSEAEMAKNRRVEFIVMKED